MIYGIIHGTSKEANESHVMKGWVVGHMYEGLMGTPEFEIKTWQYDGPIDYGKKRFGGTEFIIIYGGVLRFEIEQDTRGGIQRDAVVIRGDDKEYVIFPPGIEKTVVVVESPAFGVT